MTEPDKEDTLVVRERFRKFYACGKCGTMCYFCVTNSFRVLPVPPLCPYSKDETPEWKPMHGNEDGIKQGDDND